MAVQQGAPGLSRGWQISFLLLFLQVGSLCRLVAVGGVGGCSVGQQGMLQDEMGTGMWQGCQWGTVWHLEEVTGILP